MTIPPAILGPINSNGYVPTGTISFYDGSTLLGTVTLSNPVPPSITLSVSNLAAGSHSITAVYSGDSLFAGSTSDPLTITVSNMPMGP